ncbi:MAG: putative Ig domain-containing protein [Rivularia sp. T60_A2020_040]|nr:putative Ig domain-containing protein [Rivularia sp. T60_A2020_040]
MSSYQRNGKLDRNGNYTGELETILSPGVKGKYVVIETDANKNVWESIYEGNNQEDADINVLSSTPSDLKVVDINVLPKEDKNYSGDKTTIEWTVRNDGAAVWSGTRYWYDEIWISDQAEFNSPGAKQNKIGFVAYSPQNGLGAGESYTQRADVVLPVGYNGEYYIHISTDYSYDRDTIKFRGEIPLYGGDNDSYKNSFEYRVYENPNNNLGSEAIDITYREADLKISNVAISNNSPQSGDKINVTWNVENQGTRNTRENQWYDRIYLSKDKSLDYGDIFVGEYRRRSSLNVGNSYQGSAEIILPEGVDGSYNLLVFTDANLIRRDDFSIQNEAVDSKLARVPEFNNENNNVASISLPITLRPAADLQVTSVSILNQPPTAIIGQSFDIRYTVENKGVGSTPATQNNWTDLIYLSRDKFLDLQSDRYLGYVERNNLTLQPGESYSIEETLQAPFNLDGSYYVFVITDAPQTNIRGKVYEGVNENNNATNSIQPLIINTPPAVDLKVSNITATPTSGNVGDSVNIEWDVINDSVNSTNSRWSDAVYLSQDSEWDINDTFVGRYSYTGNPLGANDTYTANITANLPSATPNQYRFIVRTDVYNQLYEGRDIGELNNDAVAANVFNLSAESLQLNVLKEDITLNGQQSRLFEIDVEANQTLRVTLDGEENAFNEIFIRYNEAPTGVEYEAASTGIIGDKQIGTVSNTKLGKYYILVRSTEGNSSPVTLFAEELPFGVTDVAIDKGGDSRYVTTNIYGAQFKQGAVVKLVRPGIAEYIPVNYKVIDNTHIQAIFDLTHAPHGLYDVKVINPSGEEAILPYRYLVERAIEQDVTIGLGGPRIIAPGDVGTYGVSVQSLTNIDTPYVHFQFGIPELGDNELLTALSEFTTDSTTKLPYVEFTSNLRGNPDVELSDDIPWANLISDINTDGRILAPGYVLDLPNAGYVGSTFNVQTYPGLKELLKKNPSLLEDVSDEDIAFKFNILATATVMSRDEFIAEQTSEALKLRTAILKDKSASPGLITLASSEEVWTNSYLAALETAGLLRQEDDIPPIRENTQVISLMATLTSGLLLGPAGNEIISTGDLVDFFVKVREWYGHNPNLETGADIPDLKQFDKGLSRITHTSAFNVYAPFGDARLDLPPGVSVPPPSFNSFFNEKGTTSELVNLTGPIGYGEDNFIPLDTQLPYTINFENAATTNDAVGEIRIVTKLDSDLDSRSFQLGDLRLGDIRVHIPKGRSFFQEDFDFSQSKGFIVRVSAGLDIESNTVTWLLQAINPKTGEVLQNTDIGLLLPNNAEGIGKGFVSYTVLPASEIATGTEITSTARIIYNTAAPIDTASTINIVDGEAPSTTINVTSLSGASNVVDSPSPHLQKVQGSTDYLVNWEAIDDETGSGIKHVTVYVAENGGDFKIWQRQTTDTEAIFNGKADITYEFLALATDNAGNREQPVLGINAPSDGSTINLGTLPTVGETTKPEILPAPVREEVSTNPLFIKASAEIPTNLGATNKPEFNRVLRPFTAKAFATNIPQSHGEVGAMAIALLNNGNVIASGGKNRGSLYRFDSEGGEAKNPFAVLKYPVFDLALDNNGFLWGVTGGSSLIKLDSQTGEIVNEYGDSITTSLAINLDNGLIYVASGNGIEVFNPITETFSHYSDIRVDNLAINPRDGKLWATTYPQRGNVISFNEDGKAQRMVEYDSPVDSIAFGKSGTQLDNLLFVSDNSGKLHMVDTVSLESIAIATGGSRGEIVKTTVDGKVLVSQSNQIDIFNPLLAPFVKATNPAPGSTVALPQGTINVIFDADMKEGNINDAASVFNPSNYQLIDGNGNIINPLSVRYDKKNRTALLNFNGINPGSYQINILPSLENSAGLKMESGYNVQFTAVSDFSDKVEFKFSNPRSNRQNQTVSYDVTITNTADQDLQLPLMLVLDPAEYFNGEVQGEGVVSQDENGAFLIDLQDSLENGILKVGESITNRTITVFNPDAYRVELATGIYTLPYPNAAPEITSTPVGIAIALQPYNYQIQASDSDGVAEFGYLLYDAPQRMSVNENGLITWEPTTESLVNSQVTLYVFDKRGGYTKQEFTINVLGGNSQPVFNNITAISGAGVTTQDSSFTISAKEAQPLQLQIFATDTDNDKLTYWVDNLPGGAVFDAKNGILTWTPGYSSAGTLPNVKFTVTDGKERITQTATFLVAPTNQLPELKTIPSKFIREGESVRIQLKASDAENDKLTYSSKLLPGGSKLDPTTGLFEWTPGFFQAGNFEIPFTVSDGNNIVTQTALITVFNANAAPVFDNLGQWYIQEGEQLRFNAFAFDADNPDFVLQERNADGVLTILEGSEATVNYTVGNLPPGATFDAETATFTWTPDFSTAGNYNVTFTATDDGDGTGLNATTTVSVPITVYNTNRAPSIIDFENISVEKGETTEFTITATDAESDNLRFNLIREREAGFGIPEFINFVDNLDGTALITVAPTNKDASGSYSFTLVVEEIRNDEETPLYTEKTFNITVGGTNDAPQIKYIGDKVAVIGEALKFDLIVGDNNQDNLTFDIQGNPTGATFTPKTQYGRATFEWTPTTDNVDVTYPVTVKVTDSGNGNSDEIFSDEQTFNIVVRNSNTAPVLNPIPNLTPEGTLKIKEAETLELQLQATDGDGDTITYFATNLPPNASLNPETGLLTWTPNYTQSGIYDDITIIATDGNKQSTQTFSIVVENTNRSPVIIPLPTQVGDENSFLRFKVNAVDYDVEGVIYSTSDLPSGASFDNRTGDFIWKPTFEQSGQYKITFEASDASGEIGKRDVNILITNTNRNPLLKVSNRAVALGENLSFILDGSDLDSNTQLTYSANILPEGATLNAQTGEFNWTPNPGQVDNYSINFSVSDGISTVTENVLVKVANRPINPTVNLDLTPSFPVVPNQSVTITAFADSFAEIANISAKVNGETVTIDQFGRFKFTPTNPGKVEIVAVATDADGRVGNASTVIKVRNPLDNDAPIVKLAPAINANIISNITNVVGQVSDVNLDNWLLEIADFGKTEFTEIANGEGIVDNNILAQIDPNKLNNGFHQLRLTATDISGRTSSTETVVEVNSTAKTAYTRTETDLTYNFSSLPLNLTRTYNSLDNTWRFSTDTDIQTNVPLTGREDLGVYEPFRVGTRLYLTTPTGERVGFTFTPLLQQIPGLTYYTPAWVADAGVNYTLNSVDAKLTLAGNRLYQLNTGIAYNPESGDFEGASFTLSAADGTKYLIDSKKGITEQVTANGISLVYSDSGITSSTGETVQFVNSEQGLLKQIIAPDGTQVIYDYLDGNLVGARNLSTGNVQRYGYNDSGLNIATNNDGTGKTIIYDNTPQEFSLQSDLGGVVQWNGSTINGNLTNGIDRYTFGLRDGEIESTSTGIVLVGVETQGITTINGNSPLVTSSGYGLYAIDKAGLNLLEVAGDGGYDLKLNIAGDVNNDGVVDGVDSELLNQVIVSNADYNIIYDFNRDNVVNAADMQILGSNYGFTANRAPIVTASEVLTHTDLETFIQLDKLATDAEGDAIYFRLANPEQGSISFTPDGKSAVFTPNTGYFSAASFELIADDGYSTASSTIDINVSDAPLVNLDIVNRSPRLDVGESTQLVVIGDFSDQDDVILPASYLQFGSENELVGRITDTGVLVGEGDGVSIVSVGRGGISAVTALRVGDLLPTNEAENNILLAESNGLNVYPGAVILTEDATRQMLVGIKAIYESPELNDASTGTRYFVNNPDILDVSEDGLITALSNGIANITVIHGASEYVQTVQVESPTVVSTSNGTAAQAQLDDEGGIIEIQINDGNNETLTTQLMVAPGTLFDETDIRFTPLLEESQISLTTPSDFRFISGFKLEAGDNPFALPVQLTMELPSQYKDDASVIGQTVYFFELGYVPDATGEIQEKWLVAETGIVGADGMIRTSSPPWKGVRPGEYITAFDRGFGSGQLVKGKIVATFNMPAPFVSLFPISYTQVNNFNTISIGNLDSDIKITNNNTDAYISDGKLTTKVLDSSLVTEFNNISLEISGIGKDIIDLGNEILGLSEEKASLTENIQRLQRIYEALAGDDDEEEENQVQKKNILDKITENEFKLSGINGEIEVKTNKKKSSELRRTKLDKRKNTLLDTFNSFTSLPGSDLLGMLETAPFLSISYDISSLEVTQVPAIGLPQVTQTGVQLNAQGLPTFEIKLAGLKQL